MRRPPPRVLLVGIGIVVLAGAGVATGNALRSDNSEARSEVALATEEESQLRAQPTPAADDTDSLPSDRPVDSEGPVTVMRQDPLGELRDLHEQLVESRGVAVSGILDTDRLSEGVVVLDAPEVLWSADGSDPGGLISGNQLVAQLPRDTDSVSSLREARGAVAAVAAVGDDGRLLAIGMVDSTGSFLPIEPPPSLSWGLTLGGEELFRFGYTPPTGNPCDVQEPASYESPLHAITTYLNRLGNQTELSIEKAQRETQAKIDDTFTQSPSFTDPVTGFNVQVSLADIHSQLNRADTGEVNPRGAIPVEIRLLPEETANASGSRVMVFIDATRAEVLGAFPLGMQISDPTTQQSFDTAILEIAPPEEGAPVAVVVREDSIHATSCGLIAEGEAVLTIPYEDIAGNTRVSISLADHTYNTVTEFQLDD